jgi:hypothetical protein
VVIQLEVGVAHAHAAAVADGLLYRREHPARARSIANAGELSRSDIIATCSLVPNHSVAGAKAPMKNRDSLLREWP